MVQGKMIDDLLKATKEERWPEVTELLYRHWVKTSQTVYSANVDRPWEGVNDETRIANELLYPLATMFYAESAPVQHHANQMQPLDCSLRKLKDIVDIDEAKARSGQICGRMFKNGEPNYSCKECATDGTCVLCYECFVNSAHMNHKYKMHTSLGSGYCDCGDKEAWSSDYACKLHLPKEKAEDDMETDGTGLPPQISTRLHHLSLSTLKFAVNLLCWDQTEEFPRIIDPGLINVGNEAFQTILLNDETHTYDGVIRALELAIACSSAQAMRLATIVDREGRAIVRTGQRELCEQAKQSIENRTRKESNRRTQKTGPLLVKVYRSSLTALQNLAVRLLQWLSVQAQEFPPLAPIISESLLYGCSECDVVTPLGRSHQGTLDRLCHCQMDSNAVLLMLFDRRLWKAARTAFHQLLMATILMDMEHKHLFGRLLVQKYGIIFEDFIDDDHEHSVSVTSMTVQIFTVPTIARRLIIEEDALHVCMEQLREHCKRYIKPSAYNERIHQLDFTSDPYPAVLKRALYMLNDIGYLLTLVPKEGEWSDELRQRFVHGSSTVLRFLADIQNMDEVKRQPIEHQLMESEWETAFNIFLRLQEPISLLLAWARTDPAVHVQLYRLALMQISQKAKLMPEFNAEPVKVEVNGHSAMCVPFEVARRPISIHQPLWRFIGGLFCAPSAILRHYGVDESRKNLIDIFDNPPNSKAVPMLPDEPLNLKGVRTMLMEIPLRVLVLNAQAGAAQLWRRNGFSLVNQVHNYSSNLCRTEMFDRDIQLLQAIGALMEPNKFLIRLLDRYGLAKWAEIGFEESPNPTTYSVDGSTQEESSKIFTLIAEEMVHLLIIMLGERYSIGLSEEATPQKALEREIIHLLSTGPKAFSFIEKYVPNDPIIQRLSLENAVRNVGDFRRPTTLTSGQFHLKESLRTQFNPFFWHYSKHLASLAEQQQNKERTSLSRDLKACPPPIPPQFAPFFAPLLKIMESDMFVKLLRVIVDRMNKRSRFVSDGLFHRALFLLGMSLNEQRRAHEQGRSFEFLKMAMAEGVFDVLERMLDKPEVESHNDLLWWTIKTYKDVASLYSKSKAVEPEQKETNKEGREAGNVQRAAIAARKRHLAMERMRQLQNSFKTQNISLIDTSETGEQEGRATGTMMDDEPAVLAMDAGFPVCCGIGKSIVQLRPQPMVMCVLCQEDEVISFDGNPIVCSAFVQNSRLFSTKCTGEAEDSFEKSSNGDNLSIFSPINLPNELHVSTCSHLMHFKCYNAFIESTNARERTRYRPHLLNARMLNTESGEYLCPLCKRLSNCVLSVYPPMQTLAPELKGFSADRPPAVESFEEWVKALGKLVTQPVLSSKPAKEHSRKRSHSERSLAELAKQAIETAETSGMPASSMASAGISPSSVTNLPSTFEAGLPETIFEELPAGRSSSSSFSDAIVGQIQAIENNMLGEGGSAIVQQLLTYVFGGGKKVCSPKGIAEANIPPFIPNWKTLNPLLSTLDKTHLEDFDLPLPFFASRNRIDSSYSFARFSEAIHVLKACSFLVRSVASVLHAEKKPLFGAFNTRQRDCLNCFVRLTQLIPFNCQPSGLRVLLSRLLSPLLAPPFQQKLAGAQQHSKLRKTISPTFPSTSFSSMQLMMQSQLEQALPSEVAIMQIDMLTLAIELVFCIGWSWSDGERVLHNKSGTDAVYKCADGSVDELYAMRLTLVAHLFQVITAYEPPHYPYVEPKDKREKYLREMGNLEESVDADVEEIDGKEPADLPEIMSRIRELFPQRRWQFTRENELTLYNQLHSAAIAFLRPLAILYNAITLVPPPEALKDPSIVDNLVPLCRYLGLPSSLGELLAGHQVEHLFEMWSQHTIPSCVSLCLPQLPLKLNQLIELPEDFSQLINMAVNFRCPQVEEMTTTIPTLCLSCGEMLCSQSYCCQRTINGKNVGACTYHLSKCHSSTGIFLRIRECQILFFYVASDVSRGCFKPAPYVDEFGETDPGFRRGNPMHLNRELYWRIRRQWLHQEVAEEVINQYEMNHRNIGFEWQHF